MKKILSFVLCLCLMMSLALPALAAAEAPVEDAVPAQALILESILSEEAPIEETPMEEAPAEEVPAKETPVEEVPAEETPAEDGGTIAGTDLTWDYDEVSNTLRISGEGAIPDFERPDDAPWRSHYTKCEILVIESGITAIGTYAFADFTVSELTIPATVTSIGQGAFLYCHNLTAVELPEGTKTLEGDSFGGCSSLTMVFLPSTLVDYGNSEFFAFVGCDAITDVYYNGSESMFSMNLGKSYFPETTEIHYSGSASLPIGGTLADGVQWTLDEEYTLTISGTGAMPDYDHSSKTPWADFRVDIKKIVIGEGITHAGDYAFDYCSNVTELSLPDTLESIGDHTFANGATGSTIHFPAGLESIGPAAFQINKLTEVTLPEGIESVGTRAFAGGELLETVSIPATLTSIGAAAFDGCHALTEVAYAGTEADWNDLEGSSDNPNLPMLFAEPGEKFADGLYWSFEDGTLTISGDGPMPDYTAPTDAPWSQHLDELTAVVIKDGVTAVGDYTFDLCQNLTELTLPSTLESVGSAAFRGCGLTVLGFSRLCALAADAFDDNPIEVLSLGNGTTAIPPCFSDLTTLTRLELPPLFEVLDGDFIMQNENLEVVVVGTEPYEGIEFVEWMDENGNVYTDEDLFLYDLSGLTLYATYQYIWLDPGPFEDVDEDDWFYDYVKYCYQNGIVKGTSETTFEPNAGATRAEVVTVLYRLAGEPEITGTASFGDVPGAAWYHDAVAWAAAEGIAKGYDDGNFWPGYPVTRQEFLVFLNRFAGYMEMNLNTWSQSYHLQSFVDYADVADWAQEAEVWSVIMGLQTGVEYSDGLYLLPTSGILRSELAAFLCRFMDNIYSIMEVELLQSCVGRSTDYAIALFGEPLDIPSTRYKCPLNCPEYETRACSTHCWNYDGFCFYVHTDSAGNEIVVIWSYVS